MAGKIARYVTQVITGATAAGVITVGSTTGFYVGQFGYLSGTAGQAGATIRVRDVISATTLSVTIVNDPRGGGAGTVPGNIRSDVNYGFVDATAYITTGSISCPEQVVFNRNDNPLV